MLHASAGEDAGKGAAAKAHLQPASGRKFLTEAQLTNPHDRIPLPHPPRLAREIRRVVAEPEHRDLQYISFLGNSMGGLFLRFAFGLLLDRDTGATFNPQPSILKPQTQPQPPTPQPVNDAKGNPGMHAMHRDHYVLLFQ